MSRKNGEEVFEHIRDYGSGGFNKPQITNAINSVPAATVVRCVLGRLNTLMEDATDLNRSLGQLRDIMSMLDTKLYAEQGASR